VQWFEWREGSRISVMRLAYPARHILPGASHQSTTHARRITPKHHTRHTQQEHIQQTEEEHTQEATARRQLALCGLLVASWLCGLLLATRYALSKRLVSPVKGSNLFGDAV